MRIAAAPSTAPGRSAGNRSVHSTASAKRRIRRIDDRVHMQCCYVRANDTDHARKVETGMERRKQIGVRALASLALALALMTPERTVRAQRNERPRARDI